MTYISRHNTILNDSQTFGEYFFLLESSILHEWSEFVKREAKHPAGMTGVVSGL